MDKAYPTKTITVKNTDDPWIDSEIRKKIKSRKRYFDRNHTSDGWKQRKHATNKMVSNAKKAYYDKFTQLAKETGDSALYYKIVSRLKDKKAPESFFVTSLFPGQADRDIAETVADFF